MAPMFHNSDVFVAGGGPAGLAAAIAAHNAGFAVALADCARPPIDKACGEGIMPDGLAALRALGIELPPALGYPFRGIKFLSGEKSVNAYFPNGAGIGMRRTTLHEILLNKAQSLGIEMHWGARIGYEQQGVLTMNGQLIHSNWIIGADGQNSATRKWAGLDSGSVTRRRFGFRRHYEIRPWSEYVEIYWSDRAQMYITPVADNRVCVALISDAQRLRFDDGLQLFPELRAKLGNAAPVTHEQGALSPTRKLNAVFKDRVVLLGDASGSVDAITGDGLSLTFQQAAAMAEALRTGDLATYQQRHRQISQLPRFMADFMLMMDGRPRFRHRVFNALTSEPSLFERMLAIHTRAIPPLQFGIRNAVTLGWKLLAA